ncbi:MAG: MFS transporter [Myxococcota bacterium]|nr:MFS transporter [Myxococcota bacterium]
MRTRTEGEPVLRLAALWWFIFSGLGLYFPYYSLYLRENIGLSASQVGLIVATVPLMGMLAQPLWGRLGDRTGARSRILALIALGASLGYLCLAWPTGFSGYLAATACLAFFGSALGPMAVSTSLANLDAPAEKTYGRVRAMGTLGFAVSVGTLPFWIHSVPAFRASAPGASSPALGWIFLLAAFYLLAAAAFALALPRRSGFSVRAVPGDWRLLFRGSAFGRLLILTLLAYFLLQGPTVLFPLLIRAHGGGLEVISQMWLIMILLEIPLVFWVGTTMERIGPRGVIAIGLIAASVRWGISGFSDNLTWVYAAQILHGVTVWGIVVGIPLYADRIMPERLRSTGQSLLAMVGVSLGSILSNVTTGALSEYLGPKAPAQLASLALIVLLVVLPLLLKRTDIKTA